MKSVRVVHFSDVLCTWAYVSEIRIEELLIQFPGQIEIETRFVNVFGCVARKIESQWSQKGGMQAFAGHARQVVAKFDHVSMHPEIWTGVVPHSSLPSHLFLCAVRKLEDQQVLQKGATRVAAWALRQAFFVQGADVSQHTALMEVARSSGLPVGEIERLLHSGEAHAGMAEDIELAREQSVLASPSLIFNDGRQKLIGNVGYGIIEANVRELLQGSSGGFSWC